MENKEQEQEYDNEYNNLSEMQEKLKWFQEGYQEQENNMKILLQLHITDRGLLMRREQEKKLWSIKKEVLQQYHQ